MTQYAGAIKRELLGSMDLTSQKVDTPGKFQHPPYQTPCLHSPPKYRAGRSGPGTGAAWGPAHQRPWPQGRRTSRSSHAPPVPPAEGPDTLVGADEWQELIKISNKNKLLSDCLGRKAG